MVHTSQCAQNQQKSMAIEGFGFTSRWLSWADGTAFEILINTSGGSDVHYPKHIL